MKRVWKILIALALLPVLLYVALMVIVYTHREQIMDGVADGFTQEFVLPAMDGMALALLLPDSVRTHDEFIECIEDIRKMKFSSDESRALTDPALIRLNIVAYKNTHGCFPESLANMEIELQLTVDKYGNPYYYLLQGEYVVLGSMGADGVWNCDDSARASLLDSMNEFMYREGDDFIVKVIAEPDWIQNYMNDTMNQLPITTQQPR